MINLMNYWSICSYLHTWTLHSIYAISYILDPVFPENSNPDPKNVAGLRIRSYLWCLKQVAATDLETLDS